MSMFVYAIVLGLICFEATIARSHHRRNANTCVAEGQTYQHNQRIEQGNFWFTCYRGEKKLEGCMGNGVPIDFHQRFVSGRSELECHYSDHDDGQWIGIRKVGCTIAEGSNRTVDIGDIFDDPFFRYQCTNSIIDLVGCIVREDKYKVVHPVGTTYTSQTVTVDENKGLMVKVQGACERTDTGVRLVTAVACKLYRNQNVLAEIDMGCSEAVTLENHEAIFDCSGSLGGIGIRTRQADEATGCH